MGETPGVVRSEKVQDGCGHVGRGTILVLLQQTCLSADPHLKGVLPSSEGGRSTSLLGLGRHMG